LRRYLRFLISSCSGYLSLVNLAVFAAILLQTGEYGVPSPDTLLHFGAKDPVAVAQGEWWRLLSSMFLHIGPLHLFMNSYAIYVIGPQIEDTIGRIPFLVLYLTTGFIGSIASGMHTLSLSAGASGAIMGLLGFGLVIELLIGFKLRQQSGRWPKMGSYLINSLFILGMGLLIPNIDNAAHIGGLICGAGFGFIVMMFRPNNIVRSRRKGLGLIIGFLIGAYGVIGFNEITDATLVYQRFMDGSVRSASSYEKIYLTSRALELDPVNSAAYLARGRALLDANNIDLAMEDLSTAAKDRRNFEALREILNEITLRPGMESAVFRLRKLIWQSE
jgi:membrane associated rhomboid family serine protease